MSVQIQISSRTTDHPTLDEIERHIIESRLDAFSGNKTQAAKSLGISLKTLYNRLNSYRSTAASDAS